MSILTMLIRCSMLTLLFLAYLILIAGTLFVLNVAIKEWYGIDLIKEIRKWTTKHSKTK